MVDISDIPTEALVDRYDELVAWNDLEIATRGACNYHPVYAGQLAIFERVQNAPDWWYDMHDVDAELGKRRD